MGTRVALASAVVCVLAVPGAARAYHLDDTLRGSTTGTASGGTFGPAGWTVAAKDDRIWFAIPGTPASGSIEFTLSNVTNASLYPGDNDFFQIYDDADSGEPIPYRPDWVENDFKVDLRIRTDLTPTGPVKMIVGVCGNATPSWADSCSCGPPFVDDPFAGDPTWDGSPQRIRVEWGGGSVRYLRNGAEVLNIAYGVSGYAIGPRDLHFSLGTSRAAVLDTCGIPVGAVFSDLVVDTVDGTVATCPVPTMPDGGTCDPSVATPTEDVTAASWEPAVYSIPTDLNVEADATGAPTGVVFLRFPPAPGPVAHATLALHTQLGSSSAGGSGHVCRVDDDTWSETTTTWATRPLPSTTCTGGAHTVGVNEEVTWDVTALLPPNGDVNLAVVSADTDGAHFYSKESGGCSLGPRLTLLAGTPQDAGTPDGGHVGGMDAGGTPHDAGAADAGRHALPPGGCCGVAGSVPLGRGALLVALAALLTTGARRRRWS